KFGTGSTVKSNNRMRIWAIAYGLMQIANAICLYSNSPTIQLLLIQIQRLKILLRRMSGRFLHRNAVLYFFIADETYPKGISTIKVHAGYVLFYFHLYFQSSTPSSFVNNENMYELLFMMSHTSSNSK